MDILVISDLFITMNNSVRTHMPVNLGCKFLKVKRLSQRMHALVILKDVAKLPCIEIIPITLPLWRVSLFPHASQCIVFFFSFLLRSVAWGFLFPRPGIEPVAPEVGVQSLNHWTVREVPRDNLFSLVAQMVKNLPAT